MQLFRRLQGIYDAKEREYLKSSTPREWETHLLSLGVRRHDCDSSPHFVLWSDALKEWLDFPEELTNRVLALGFIP